LLIEQKEIFERQSQKLKSELDLKSQAYEDQEFLLKRLQIEGEELRAENCNLNQKLN